MELIDASNKHGEPSIKKSAKIPTSMAQANKAFAHYRW